MAQFRSQVLGAFNPSATFLAWEEPELYNKSFQIIRLLGIIDFGGSDFTEIWYVISRIDPRDDESWYREWHRMAKLVEAQAREAERHDNRFTARCAFQRASNYERAAQFYLTGSDERKVPTLRRQQDYFLEASKYFENPIDRVQVPYDGTTLPGYFVRAEGRKVPAATILYMNGADSLSEEAYFTVALPASKAGYSCLVYNAPGVGLTLYEKGLPARYDCEHYVRPVVDFLGARDDVDASKIVLVGESLAGYFVPRSAAFEQRVAAAVSWGTFYDASGVRHRPARPHWLSLFGAKTQEEFNEISQKWDLKGVLQKITCPFFVITGSEDFAPNPANQAIRYYNEVGSKVKAVKVIEPGEGLGGVTHCQKDNLHVLHAETFNWLNSIFS